MEAAAGEGYASAHTLSLPVAPPICEDAWAVVVRAAAAAAFATSSWAATCIGRTELGPAHPLDPGQLREHLSDLTRGLREGARYLVRRVTPAQALLVMAVQRFLYGLVFVAAIVIARNVLADPADTDAGLAAFAAVLVFAGVGFGLAAILTPTLGPWISRHTWVVWCCVIGAAGQVVLAASASAVALYIGAAVVSFAVQGGKIAVDTIVQRDTEDDVRGRAFMLYDMAYNIAFVSSAGVAALVLPDSGYSRVVMVSLAVAYLLVAALYAVAPRTPSPLARPLARRAA
jgi:MFS family permease